MTRAARRSECDDGGHQLESVVDRGNTTPRSQSAAHHGGVNRERLRRERQRVQQLVAKHEHRPLLDIALRIYQRDRESAGTVVGSAVAFRLFLFFVPFVLFIVGLLGFLRTWSTTEGMAEQAGVTGQLAIQIDAALSQPNSSRWIATLLGLIGMVWAGRSLSRVMVSASCLAWRLPVLAKASMRVVGGVVGVFAGIGLIVTIMNRVRAELGLAAAGLSFLAVVVVYGVAWGVLCR